MADQELGIKSNQRFNEAVKRNADMLADLQSKLPQYFVDGKFDKQKI